VCVCVGVGGGKEREREREREKLVRRTGNEKAMKRYECSDNLA